MYNTYYVDLSFESLRGFFLNLMSKGEFFFKRRNLFLPLLQIDKETG